MSKVSEQLVKYAQEEKKAHEEYIKDFSTSTIAHLVKGGVERLKAGVIVKEALLRNSELTSSVGRANILEKTAQYIEVLEEENIKLQVKISTASPVVEKQAEIPEHLKKLAQLGFTPEELEAMKDVPEKVLEKVADTAGQPWELGKGVGPAVEKTDPLLDWILS